MREIPKLAASIRPTLLDRAIMALDPERGLKRMRARTMMAAAGGYNGGRKDRRPTKLWRPDGGSADADVLPDLSDLRARTRDLERNAPLAAGAIATTVTNVAAYGLELQASIDNEALGISPARADEMEREQEREWAVFCKTADFTRVQHLDEMAPMTLRAVLQSGDVFAIRRYRKDPGDLYGTKVLLVEADRVSNPDRGPDTATMSAGVEFNADGVPLRYHVSDRHPGALRPGKLTWSPVAARSDSGLRTVIHLYDRVRPDLSRGIPYLSPVIEHLKQLADYSDAEISAAVVSAMYTGFVTTEAPETSTDPVVGQTDTRLASDELKLGAGVVHQLLPGEKFEFANPTRPNANFDPFFQAFCRQIGVALELPFEILVKHFTASYSASRAALEMAWQFFRKKRNWLARNFYAEIYGWMMDEAVAAGRLDRPGYFEDPFMREAYLGAEWIGPQRASLNPLQESKADSQDVEAGFKTIEQVCAERTGGEFEKKNAQRAKEVKLRSAAGLGLAPPPPAAPDPAEDPANDDDSETKPQRSAAK